MGFAVLTLLFFAPISALAFHYDNMYPTSNYSPSCALNVNCQAQNRYHEYYLHSSLPFDFRVAAVDSYDNLTKPI